MTVGFRGDGAGDACVAFRDDKYVVVFASAHGGGAKARPELYAEYRRQAEERFAQVSP